MARLYIFMGLFHRCTALRAELARHFGTALRTSLRTYCCHGRTALRAELAVAFGAALRAFHHGLGCRSGSATLGAELAGNHRAALRAGNAFRGGLATLVVGVVVGLLALVVPSILHCTTGHAACASIHHAEADEGIASASFVAGCGFHDIDDLALLHHRVGAVFVTVDLLLAGIVQ